MTFINYYDDNNLKKPQEINMLPISSSHYSGQSTSLAPSDCGSAATLGGREITLTPRDDLSQTISSLTPNMQVLRPELETAEEEPFTPSSTSSSSSSSTVESPSSMGLVHSSVCSSSSSSSSSIPETSYFSTTLIASLDLPSDEKLLLEQLGPIVFHRFETGPIETFIKNHTTPIDPSNPFSVWDRKIQVSDRFFRAFTLGVFLNNKQIRELSSEQFDRVKQVARLLGKEDDMRKWCKGIIMEVFKPTSKHVLPMKTVDLVLSMGQALSWLGYTCYDPFLAKKLEDEIRANLKEMSIEELNQADLAVDKFKIWFGGVKGAEFRDLEGPVYYSMIMPRLETLGCQIWKHKKSLQGEYPEQLFVLLKNREMDASKLALEFPNMYKILLLQLHESIKEEKQHPIPVLEKIALLDASFDAMLSSMNEGDIENMTKALGELFDKLKSSNPLEINQTMIDFVENLARKLFDKMSPLQLATTLVRLSSHPYIPAECRAASFQEHYKPIRESSTRLLERLQNLMICDIESRPDYYKERSHHLELKTVEREVFSSKEDGPNPLTTCWKIRNEYCTHPGVIIEEAAERGNLACVKKVAERLPKVSDESWGYQGWLSCLITKREMQYRFGPRGNGYYQDKIYTYPCWKSEVTKVFEKRAACNWYETRYDHFWD